MKVQSRNLVYRKALVKCFMCNASRLDSRLGSPNLILLRCINTSEKCDLKNLYNDKIFKL